jgi:hypothetical protein
VSGFNVMNCSIINASCVLPLVLEVYLSLNGVTIPNDGYVLASDIGYGDTGLHCNTDKSDCCRGADHPNGIVQGDWYRPDGSQVGSFTQEDASHPTRNFFARNRGAGIVRLNHYGNPSERGRFRCEVPNAAGVNVTMYVNIGEWFYISSSTVNFYKL